VASRLRAGAVSRAGAKHDDQIDALVLALSKARNRPSVYRLCRFNVQHRRYVTARRSGRRPTGQQLPTGCSKSARLVGRLGELSASFGAARCACVATKHVIRPDASNPRAAFNAAPPCRDRVLCSRHAGVSAPRYDLGRAGCDSENGRVANPGCRDQWWWHAVAGRMRGN